MHSSHPTIQARGFGLSESSILYLGLLYIAAMWAWILLFVPLVKVFPVLKQEWLGYFPMYFVPVLLLAHILGSFFTVSLSQEAITLFWFGIRIRSISPAELKFFCAVGNEREDLLCLSTRSLEETAQLEEKHLLKNYFTKYEVDLVGRQKNPQDVLARKYLNRMRRSILGRHRDRKILLLRMDPVVQQQLRWLYSQLLYKNYTGVSNHKAIMFWDKTKPPCFCMPDARDSVEVQKDAVVLRRKQEMMRQFLPGSIQTIVRVDIFRGYDKFFPHHLPVLFLSVYSPAEMAAMTKTPEPSEQLQAYRYAQREVSYWTIKKEHCCNLLYTDENVSRLKNLFPAAQWIDISDSWLLDTP
jgi:hypothetical protein